MGKKYTEIGESHRNFIEAQKIFFVATTPKDGRINLSPKGVDTLRVVGSNRVVWLNITGSGNETAAHLMEDNRMTLMFCSFEKNPMILRLYGHARAVHPGESEWEELISLCPKLPGLRQALAMDVDLVHNSCGSGVPFYEFKGERTLLTEWVAKKGEAGIREFWQTRNSVSIDGKPTGILESKEP